MKNISKGGLVMVISSLGFAGGSATVTVTAISQNPQLRLFINVENNWIIAKEDLESEEDKFSKVTSRGNTIEYSKTNNSVSNFTPLIGLESVTLQSTNSYLQLSTGFNGDSFLCERYFKNDRTKESNN